MAANSGIIDGGDVMVYINKGTDIAPDWTPMFHSKECSIKHSTEIRKRMTKDTGKSAKKRAGEQTTTISMSALTCYGADNYFDLRAMQIAGTEVKLKYSGRPLQDVTDGNAEVSEQVGDKYEEGLFIINSVERNDVKNEDSTMTASFENSGLVEIKTVAA